MTAPDRRRGILELDVLRGIAALEVAIWHWSSMGRMADPFFTQIKAGLYRGSEFAVTTFFVLSGVVLTLSIVHASNRPTGEMLLGYFVRRIARIMPLLIAVVSVSMVGMYLLRYFLGIVPPWSVYSVYSFDMWFRNVTFRSTQFNPPGWTLLYEIVAYTLLPFLVLALIRKGWERWLHALVFLVLSIWIGTTWMTPDTFKRLMPMFLPGIFIGLVVRTDSFRQMSSVTMLLLGVLALGILAQIELKHYDLSILVATGCACLICAAIRLESNFVPKPLKWLGDVSYGVYLWHYPTLWAMFYLQDKGFVGTKDAATWLWSGAVGLPLTLLLAHISFTYLEKPVMTWAGQLVKRMPFKRVEAAPAE